MQKKIKMSNTVDYLEQLENEAIYILRETAAQFEKPALLFSGGKDSIVLVHLALKAFRPGKFPFPLVHIDTGHNFPEAIQFRDELVEKIGEKLVVGYVEDSIKKYNLKETGGRFPSRNSLQTYTLLDTIEENEFDACIGGARRDEEKARAKERIFSVRDDFGAWDPKLQRPELWNILNGRVHKDESIRVFPLSNWTELDIWQYIYLEQIPIVPLYFAASRPVVEKDGVKIMVDDERMPIGPEDVIKEEMVRFRTLGCYPLTGAVNSTATTLEEIIKEMLLSRTSERQGRVIDNDSAGSMEKKKIEGYF